MPPESPPAPVRSLAPYAARLALVWAGRADGADVDELDGTLVKVDLSGFTRLSERLARSQLTGAEELTAVLDDLWTCLIDEVLDRGGDVLQFGGDALVVWFDGEQHGARAAAATWAMQAAVRSRQAEQTPAGPVRLRMSAGAASGRFVVGLVGREHRELVVLGPAASEALRCETAAAPGQVVLNGELAEAVVAAGGRVRRLPDGALLRSTPAPAPVGRPGPGRAFDGRRFLAPEVRELEEAGVPLGEHRRVTVAFVHLGGTDALVEQGPQVAHAAAAELARAVEDAAGRYRVCWTASDLAADGVVHLLVGGAPRSSEQDEERVLRAARAVVEACPAARVGVHTGRAFAGDVGHPERRTYAVLGDTTNTAARLMSRAAPGAVLASRATWQGSDQDHEVQWTGALALKGRRTAVEAGVVGPRRASQRRSTHDLPLVGRDDEAVVLQRLVDGLTTGTGSSVLLLGPAGQGKSRLVAAAAAAAHAAGVEVLVATANPYEASSPYGAVRPSLRRLLRLGPGGADRLRQLSGPDAALAPLLGLPLGIDLPATPESEAVDPRFVQQRRDDLLAGAILRAVGRPLLVVLEDLHSCDRATLHLLDVLAACATRAPLAVLATGRHLPPDWSADDPAWHRVDLAPLERVAARRLVLAAAGDTAVDDADLDRLLDEAAGNPLFLRELVSWVGRGVDSLPDGLEQVVAARIDTLPPADRALLRQTAVVGGSAEVALLATVLADPGLLDAERWSSLGDFVERTASGVRFRHDLHRRTAYLGLAVRRRRALHAATAAHLELGPAPDAATLAAHLHAAQRWADAQDWATRAAQAAHGQGALADALGLYGTALDAGRRAGAGAVELAALEEPLGDVAEMLGRYTVADDALRRAARAADGRDRARRTVKRATVVERAGRYRFALSLLTSAERALGPDGDPALRRAAWLRRSSTLHRCGRLRESAELARRVADEAEAAGDGVDRARALLRLEMVTSELGLEERFDVGAQALSAFADVDEPRDLASLLGNLGITALEADDWELAARRHQESAEAYRRAGDAVGRAFAVNNAAEVLCEQGRLEQAREQFLEARRTFRAAGHRFGIGCTASALGRIAARSGDVAAARPLLDEAMVALHDMPHFVADTRVRVAELSLLAGAPDAVAVTDAVVDELARVDAGPVVPLTARRFAAVALAQAGRHDEAAAALREVLGAARAAGVLIEVAMCLHHLAALGDRSGEAARDDVLGRLGVVGVPSYGLG